MRVVSSSREEWLEQRRSVLTATELAEIASSPGAARRIRVEKETGRRSFRGNRYTEWGSEREAFIADYVRYTVESDMEQNFDLWISDDDPQVGATPDMILPTPRGVAWVGEIKTVIKHKDWGDGRIPQRYYDQVQLQLFVTGAEKCIFAWEPYEDADGVFFPCGPISVREFGRDEQRIAELLKIKEGYFDDGVVDAPDVEALVVELVSWNRQIAELEAKRDECKREIRMALGDEPQSWSFDGLGTIQITKPSVRRSFDKKRFEKDHPDLAESYVNESEIKPTFKFVPVKEGK